MFRNAKNYIKKVCSNKFAEYSCSKCKVSYVFPLVNCIVKYGNYYTTYPRKCDCGFTMVSKNFKLIKPILKKIEAFEIGR